jgi:hypothetical protein
MRTAALGRQHQLRRAALVVLACALGSAGAAGPAPQPARAGTPPRTVVTLDSEAGDSVGLGRAWTFVPPSETVAGSGGPGVARVRAVSEAISFDVELSAPEGEELVVGPYEGATLFRGTTPGIWIVRGSQVCSGGTGRFDVLEAPSYGDGGTLLTFAADFEFRCDPAGPTLHGSVRVGSTVDVTAIHASPDTLAFGSGTLFIAGDPMSVVFANVGTLPVAIGAPSLSGPNPGSFLVASGCPAVLEVDARCSLAIRFKPDAPSGVTATLVTPADSVRWGYRTTLTGTGQAAPVSNGSPEDALAFSTLPFEHGGTTYTLAASGSSWIACPGDYEALWYRFTSPVKRVLRLEAALGLAAVTIMTSPTAMFLACGMDQPITITAEAGVTYWIKVQRRWPGDQLLGLRATEGPADTEVAATGLGISRTTFYPVVDGYYDTLAIRGTRNEKASVSVAIYSPLGSRVRSLSTAAARGSYSISWDGRTSSGTLAPSGKYRVVQTVTDLWGNRLAVASYVNLSRKRLYTYTYAKTLDGAAYSARGTAGTGSISRSGSAYGGGVRIATGSNGSAGVGYAFSVPSATIYKSVKFEVLGRGRTVSGAGTDVGVQDWTLCTGWDDSCVDTWASGPMAYGWAGIKVTGKRHVSSTRRVRGYVEVWTYGGLSKWEDIRDVRATVVYGILK